MLLTDDLVVTEKALNLVKSHISKSVHLKTLAVACWKFTKVKPDFVGLFVNEDLMFPYDVAPAKIL